MKHYITSMILAAMVCLAATSCSDSESDSEHGKSTQTQELADSVNYGRYMLVVSQLFDYDAFDTTNVDYQPKYGEVLEVVSPTVYSIGVKNEAEARRWFLEHCVPAVEADSVDNLKQDNMTLDFGKYGNLKYVKGNSSSSYATVYLDFPAVKTQKQIDFIPMDRWPHNDSSPFYVGDIVQRKDNQQYYICVRACEGGLKGILLSFSSLWVENSERSYDSSTLTYKSPVGASLDAWDALAQLYDEDPKTFKSYIKEISKKIPDFKMLQFTAIRNLVYDYDADEKPYPCEPRANHRGWLLTWWDIYQTWVFVGKNKLKMEDGMPRFARESEQIANWKGYSYRAYKAGSHSEEFLPDKSVYDTYQKVFDAQDAEANK